jgi:hypothetical protein
MSISERIAKLEEFKKAIIDWNNSDHRKGRESLRTYINQNKTAAKREIIEAGCFKTITISPPPAIGGLIMRNVDVFDAMFDPPYLMNLVPTAVDMIDETVGIMSAPDFGTAVEEQLPVVEDEVEVGYAFVAMPMDPNDPQLEDVLDAIKEACDRCGIRAERIDEPESNERITDRILESIRKAEYVIVDLTHSKPNVFYEAGYAQGRQKTPIYIAKSGTQLEFDLKDYPIIIFNNMKTLKDRLEKRIRGLAEERQTTRTAP